MERGSRYCVSLKDHKDGGGESDKIVRIKIFDILFDDGICSLVWMQDLTKFGQESEDHLQKEEYLTASKSISERIKLPQETIITLTRQLLDTCSKEQAEVLKVIELETRMV